MKNEAPDLRRMMNIPEAIDLIEYVLGRSEIRDKIKISEKLLIDLEAIQIALDGRKVDHVDGHVFPPDDVKELPAGRLVLNRAGRTLGEIIASPPYRSCQGLTAGAIGDEFAIILRRSAEHILRANIEKSFGPRIKAKTFLERLVQQAYVCTH